MCKICSALGIDYKFNTGIHTLFKTKLFKVYKGRVAKVDLCRLHDIELWRKGEVRFLKEHIDLARDLANQIKNNHPIFDEFDDEL